MEGAGFAVCTAISNSLDLNGIPMFRGVQYKGYGSFVSLSLSLSHSFFLSPGSLSLSLYLSLSLSVSLTHSLTHSLSLSLSLSLSGIRKSAVKCLLIPAAEVCSEVSDIYKLMATVAMTKRMYWAWSIVVQAIRKV